MAAFIAFFLGYLTCYLEIAGHTWGSTVAGLVACLTVAIRMMGSVMLQPVSTRFWGLVARYTARWPWLYHHLQLHPEFDRTRCSQCN